MVCQMSLCKYTFIANLKLIFLIKFNNFFSYSTFVN